MQAKKPSVKLSSELSDLVNFIVENHWTSSEFFSIFEQKQRFRLYDKIAEGFLNDINCSTSDVSAAADIYSKEGRVITADRHKILGDAYFKHGGYLSALEHYQKAGSLVSKERFREVGEGMLKYYAFDPTYFELADIHRCYALAGGDAPTDKLNLVADSLLEKWKITRAREIYRFIGHVIEGEKKKELKKIAKFLLMRGSTDEFCSSYYLLEEDFPVRKIVARAKKHLAVSESKKEESALKPAVLLYYLARDRLTSNQKIAFGKAFFEKGEIDAGESAYKRAGKKLDAEEFIKIGGSCFGKNNLDSATDAYFRAHELRNIGEGELSTSYISYTKLIQIADKFLERGLRDKARMIYGCLYTSIPKEKRIRAGELAIKRGDFDNAKHFYVYAEEAFPDKKVLQYAADHITYSPELAEKAYNLVYGQNLPPGRAFTLARAYLKRLFVVSSKKNYLTKAVDYYRQAGKDTTAAFLEQVVKREK